MSFFKKLKEKISQKTEEVTVKFKEGLTKTRDAFVGKVEDLVRRYKKIDDDFFEELEEILISADVGVNTVLELVDDLRSEAKKQRIEEAIQLKPLISEKLEGLLNESVIADTSFPNAPGSRRTMLSMIVIAGSSPPVKIKSPTEISSVIRCWRTLSS